MGRRIEDREPGQRINEPINLRSPVRRLPFGRRSRIVILVHGFNVDEESARGSFSQFRDNLAAFSNTLAQQIVYLYWPGHNRFLGPAFYPFSLRSAVRLASRLTGLLRDVRGLNGGSTELLLIGHSLGCRLILESLQRLSALGMANWINRVTIFLMAAAVPTRLVDVHGRLENGIGFAQRRFAFFRSATRPWVFPSRPDSLQLWTVGFVRKRSG